MLQNLIDLSSSVHQPEFPDCTTRLSGEGLLHTQKLLYLLPFHDGHDLPTSRERGGLRSNWRIFTITSLLRPHCLLICAQLLTPCPCG